MAFTQFTSPNKVKSAYPKLILRKEDFIPETLTHVAFSDRLQREIKFGLKTYKPSEAFADKFLIAPILNELWQNHLKLNLWTQPFIKVDEVLQGRPDYLISPVEKEQYELLSLPIVVLVEAKQENFTEGWGQCLVEMLACQKLNHTTGTIIYGIVSTGQAWEFGKLEGENFTKDANTYTLANLQQVVNIVNYIFEQAEKEIPNVDTSIVLNAEEEIVETQNNF